jgi:hypothetical protein
MVSGERGKTGKRFYGERTNVPFRPGVSYRENHAPVAAAPVSGISCANGAGTTARMTASDCR